MVYWIVLTICYFSYNTFAFLDSVLIPVYDVNTEKRLLFPEEYLRMFLKKQAIATGGKSEEIIGPLDKDGYVINEDGQLIPIKIYKKGNCRGGLTPREADNIYEVEVYKRQLTRKKKFPVPATRSFKLSKLPDSSDDQYPNFVSWNDETGLYQDDDATHDDRFSFLMNER